MYLQLTNQTPPAYHRHMTDIKERPLTKAQKKYLGVLARYGFVEHGGWNRGQRNRPLGRLASLGYATMDYGPPGSFLKTFGFIVTQAGRDEADRLGLGEDAEYIPTEVDRVRFILSA